MGVTRFVVRKRVSSIYYLDKTQLDTYFYPNVVLWLCHIYSIRLSISWKVTDRYLTSSSFRRCSSENRTLKFSWVRLIPLDSYWFLFVYFWSDITVFRVPVYSGIYVHRVRGYETTKTDVLSRPNRWNSPEGYMSIESRPPSSRIWIRL